jgi:hypothetical protein
MASDDMMADGLEKVSKDTVVAYSRHYPGISVETLRKATQILNQDSRWPSRVSNWVHPLYVIT